MSQNKSSRICRFAFGLIIIAAVLASGCAQVLEQQQPDNKEIGGSAAAKFSCENDNSDAIQKRGYILLMGLASHHKEEWVVEKKLMEQDPKAEFVVVYDQDEKLHIDEISRRFLEDTEKLLEKQPVDELVLFGSSAGGVTASYSISRLKFTGQVALHTMASPIKGYDLTGFRAAFLGDREGYLRDIAIGFKPFETPGSNVKVYHHKTVTDQGLKDYCGNMQAFCDVREIQNNNIEGSKEFYYPQHDHDTIMKAVVREVLKCYNQNLSLPDSEDATTPKLGSLCTGEEGCNTFCEANRGRCQEYCRNNPENTFCQERFTQRDEDYEDYNYFGDVLHLPPCGDKKEFFTKLPLALDDFTTIEPLGLLSPTSHTFPAPHLYFRIKREGSSFESPVAKVPLYAPADITITKINLIQATSKPEFADDAAVHFALCSEFKAYFDHVVNLAPKLQKAYDSASTDRCDEYTLTYKTGPVDWKKCDKNVNLKVSEGELIGYAGGGQGQAVLDFAAFDSRIEPNNYASPKRVFRTELSYNVCPLDYFSQNLSGLYRARLGGYGYSQSNSVIISPTCGEVIQDVSGTAKGNWFAPGIDTTRFGHEPPHLALVQGHIDQDLQAFSNGESTKNSGLDFAIYYFTPQDSGLVNRDFAQVKPDGNVYCYDTKNNYKNDEPTTIIIQLTDPETLKIEGLDTTSCGSGPWTFDTFTEFER